MAIVKDSKSLYQEAASGGFEIIMMEVGDAREEQRRISVRGLKHEEKAWAVRQTGVFTRWLNLKCRDNPQYREVTSLLHALRAGLVLHVPLRSLLPVLPIARVDATGRGGGGRGGGGARVDAGRCGRRVRVEGVGGSLDVAARALGLQGQPGLRLVTTRVNHDTIV